MPKLDITLAITNPENPNYPFDDAAVKLLLDVKRFSSINAIAKYLDMPFTTVWRNIRRIEETLDLPLVVSDGSRGVKLTSEGETVLNAYLDAGETAETIMAQAIEGLVQ